MVRLAAQPLETGRVAVVAGLLPRIGSALPSGHESPGCGSGTLAASPGSFDGTSDAGRGDAVVIESSDAHSLSPLKAGDGIVFDAADWRSPEEREEGGRVYQVTALKNGEVRLHFANNAIEFARVRIGDWVWRSHDPELDKVSRLFTNAATPVHKQPVKVLVTARVGEPLVVEWSLEASNVRTRVQSEEALASSYKHPVTLELLRDQLGRLGNTAYTLTGVQAVIEGNPFVPTSVLNDLRRQAVAQLEALQSQTPTVIVNDFVEALHAAKVTCQTQIREQRPRLHLLVRTPEQLDAAIAVRPDSITLDYLDLYGLRPAVERVQAADITARVASPRVLKPDEQRIVTFLLGLGCDIVVRSTGLLQALRLREERACMDWRLQPECCQRPNRACVPGPRASTAHTDARPERRSSRGSCPSHRIAQTRSHCLPPPAGFSYRALRVLPLSLAGDQLRRLWPPVREASGRAA